MKQLLGLALLLIINISNVSGINLWDNSFFSENYLLKNQLIYYYQDSTNQYSDLEIINNDVLFKRHYVAEKTNFVSDAKTKMWLKVFIDTSYSESLVIKFLPYFKSITTYYYDKDSLLIKQSHQDSGDFNPDKYYSTSVILNYKPSNSNAYYIKFEFNKVFMMGVFELSTYKNLFNWNFLNSIYYSFLLSSIGLIALLAIFYAIINKEIANIYYSLYAIFFGLYVVPSFNLWPYILNNFITRHNLFYYYIPFSLSTIFFVLYSFSVLGNRRLHVKTYYLLIALVIIKVITITIFPLFTITYQFEYIFNKTDILIYALLIYYAICQTTATSAKTNWSFMIGLIIFFIAQFLHIFYNYSHWIFNIMYFEVLWFGVGISINYRKAKQEKIGALQEVIQVKSNYNTQLEQEVKERTLQLENNLQTIAHLNNVLKENNIDLEHNIATLEQDRVLNKDMNLDEFKTRFDNAEKCMDLLMDLKWKDGFVCNVCESKSFFLVNKASPYVKKCKECKKTHSATSDTLFHNLKFPLEKAFYILFLSASSKKYSVQQISDLIDLRVATVWSFRKKIEEKMEQMKFHKKNNLTWQDLII